MEDPKPWLCQGDVFQELPLVLASLGTSGVEFDTGTTGVALLLTNACQLDKRRGDGTPSVSRLQFAPVHALADSGLSEGIIGQLRGGWLSPPDAVYIDDPGNGEPAIALLSEAFTIPATYFNLTVADFAGIAGSDPEDPHHAVARSHGDRARTMTEVERQLLHYKMSAFWTGTVPEGAPDH